MSSFVRRSALLARRSSTSARLAAVMSRAMTEIAVTLPPGPRIAEQVSDTFTRWPFLRTRSVSKPATSSPRRTRSITSWPW